MLEDAWPQVLLGLRVGMALALYLFLFVAIRALRAEIRARTMPIAFPARAGGAFVPSIAPAHVRVPPGSGSTAAAPPRHRGDGDRERDHLEVIGYEAEGDVEGGARVIGRSFALRGPSIIGRGASNSIVLPERHISSRHARLVPGDGGWWVEDLGSTNGTYVGARRISGRARLDPDAEVRFGPVIARLVRGDAR